MPDHEARLRAIAADAATDSIWLDLDSTDRAAIRWALDEVDRLRDVGVRQDHRIEQILGKPLGYPMFADDQRNFPGSDESHGVCVGEHVAESLAEEAAARIGRLTAERDAYHGLSKRLLFKSGDYSHLSDSELDRLTRRAAGLAVPAPEANTDA